ncbi:hypothetical protein [Streptosporangium sp. NPDC002524]|uniref:hypothetical protein n=1 Tax=Streptosporangium sp. NPDC002524 TaxID=3154537 RepID=UPI0033234D8D
MRHLDEHEENPRNTLDPEPSQKPDLLGWHLDLDVLCFLTATGAALDVDEYDMTWTRTCLSRGTPLFHSS